MKCRDRAPTTTSNASSASTATRTKPEGHTDFRPDVDYPLGFIPSVSASDEVGSHMADFLSSITGPADYGETVAEPAAECPAEPAALSVPTPTAFPDAEDCVFPVAPVQKTRKILVPELLTMTKYFFDNYRLPMYSYVTRMLRSGALSSLVGARVLNRTINRDVLSFPNISYWRIDRSSLYTDVRVELKLNTVNGPLTWNGWLVFWCAFLDDAGIPAGSDGGRDGFKCTIEDLTATLDRKADGYTQLDSYLIPFSDNKHTDAMAERLWMEYDPDALHDPKKRNAYDLAKAMGLTVKLCRIYEHEDVDTILFFEEGDLVVGEDYKERQDGGRDKHIKTKKPDVIHIPAKTIVINENLIKRQYSAFGVYHEVYHFAEHYLCYRLQKMGCNDPRTLVKHEVIVDADYNPKEHPEVSRPIDALFFMEQQANRGAYGLMLPATSTRKLIESKREEVGACRHAGARYEEVGKKMSAELMLPHFRIRARMIQLGYIQAKGSLNYVERKLIEPFAFDVDAWRAEVHTYVIEPATVRRLASSNDQFRAIMESGRYIYADGHVVRNDARFVYTSDKDDWDVCGTAECYSPDGVGGFDNSYTPRRDRKLLLTDWANAHVDDCCLRFVRVYVQQNLGRYVFGRMYFDADYIKQTQFYLNDLMNSQQIDELDAKNMYIQSFPKTFKGAIELLKKKNKVNNPMLAEYLHMDDSTFARSLSDPRVYMNPDYLTLLCLYFKLPDWISRLVFKRACIQLDEDVRRHQALLHILRVQSNDGVDAANDFLVRSGLEELKI